MMWLCRGMARHAPTTGIIFSFQLVCQTHCHPHFLLALWHIDCCHIHSPSSSHATRCVGHRRRAVITAFIESFDLPERHAQFRREFCGFGLRFFNRFLACLLAERIRIIDGELHATHLVCAGIGGTGENSAHFIHITHFHDKTLRCFVAAQCLLSIRPIVTGIEHELLRANIFLLYLHGSNGCEHFIHILLEHRHGGFGRPLRSCLYAKAELRNVRHGHYLPFATDSDECWFRITCFHEFTADVHAADNQSDNDREPHRWPNVESLSFHTNEGGKVASLYSDFQPSSRCPLQYHHLFFFVVPELHIDNSECTVVQFFHNRIKIREVRNSGSHHK